VDNFSGLSSVRITRWSDTISGGFTRFRYSLFQAHWNRNTYFNREDNGNPIVSLKVVYKRLSSGNRRLVGTPIALTPRFADRNQGRRAPNDYEPGRANIVVYNWNLNSTVAVDVSSAMAVGTRYEVRNVAQLFWAPVASGTTRGKHYSTDDGTATGPLFNAFVLLPVWVNASPTVTITSPAMALLFTGPVNISINTPQRQRRHDKEGRVL
jgi:hypothetical protein